jgi:hypothetical protein
MSPSAADKYADRWLHKVKRRLAKPVRATTTQESIHPIRGPENNRTAAVLRRVDTMHNARYATGNIIKTRLSNIHDNWLHFWPRWLLETSHGPNCVPTCLARMSLATAWNGE